MVAGPQRGWRLAAFNMGILIQREMKIRLKSAQLIPLSFFIAILLGTLVLMLPAAAQGSKGADPLTALFTATTSLCVTGLVVVDTYAYWSLFGKICILVMIQIGGLGIITVTSVLLSAFQKKISLSQSLMIHDMFNLDSMDGLRRFLLRVVRGTLVVEGAGALFYLPVFIPGYGVLKGIWYSVFTAISAFCNAGIDILGPDSLIPYQSQPLMLVNTMGLIVMGGLGYVVWFDLVYGVKRGIKKHYSPLLILRRLGEHTKLVLALTGSLIIFGAGIILVLEYTNGATIGNLPLGQKLLHALFQSVTFRTAGFAAIPQQALRESTCAFGTLLMFIGGSPVGTAGGVKTVTFFLAMINMASFIRQRKENVVFGRKISSDLIHKSAAILTVSFFVTFVLLLALMGTNPVTLTDGMFETFSATATVGLSRGLTGSLNTAGRAIIILAMYLGRIGPISMALFFQYSDQDKNSISFARGRFYVG